MKFIITENKVESLKQIAQYLIDNELNNLRIMSDEEWGMGEMDEINEVSSIDKIIVDKLEMSDGVNIYVDMYVSTDREEFDLVIGAVEYSLEQWLPNVKVHINKINVKEMKMKKVVRLSENDLNRLVRRIINEAPFDDSRNPSFGSLDDFGKMSDDEINDKMGQISSNRQKYQEFEKNGIPMNERDVELLLSIAKDYCNSSKTGGRKHYGCAQLGKIEQKIDDVHNSNFSKRSKHSPWDYF